MQHLRSCDRRQSSGARLTSMPPSAVASGARGVQAAREAGLSHADHAKDGDTQDASYGAKGGPFGETMVTATRRRVTPRRRSSAHASVSRSQVRRADVTEARHDQTDVDGAWKRDLPLRLGEGPEKYPELHLTGPLGRAQPAPPRARRQCRSQRQGPERPVGERPILSSRAPPTAARQRPDRHPRRPSRRRRRPGCASGRPERPRTPRPPSRALLARKVSAGQGSAPCLP